MEQAPTQRQTALRRPARPAYQAEEKGERISRMIAFIFIVLAFSVDLFEMLLEWLGIGIMGLSTLISVSATVIFWVFFKLKDVSFSGKPKNITRFGTTAFLELIPGLDAIFGFVWTLGIFALVASTMEEDSQNNMIVTLYQFTLKKLGL